MLTAALLWTGCRTHQPMEQVQPLVTVEGQDMMEAETAPGSAWWKEFAAEDLDLLVEKALEGNLGLQTLAARIEQAEALSRLASAPLKPQVDAAIQGGASDSDLRTKNNRRDSYSISGLFEWEIDLWGRLRSQRDAQILDRDALAEDLATGRLLLSAAVAETYFGILEQREQLSLIQKQLQVNETLLELTQLRFGQGQSSIVDVLQQRDQVFSTTNLIPQIETRLAELENDLSVLLGRLPEGGSSLPRVHPLPDAPHSPAVGIASQLLRQRPDLRAAELRIRAADRRVGAALADRYPRFVINASLGIEGTPSPVAIAARTFGNLVAPITAGGARKAVIEARQAEVKELLADYTETFLIAVAEVESTLVAEKQQSIRVAMLERQADTAARLLRETRNRYSQGLTDYLPVLNAVTNEQNLQRTLITSRRELLTLRVALHRALGGPLTNPTQPAS